MENSLQPKYLQYTENAKKPRKLFNRSEIRTNLNLIRVGHKEGDIKRI
jgi:hypothetical protein